MFYRSISEIDDINDDINIIPSIYHIINPFNAKDNSEHDVAQTITFKSISRAVNFSRDLDININCVVFPEDQHLVPEEFTCIPLLDKSIADKYKFDSKKKLPLLFDIINYGLNRSKNKSNEYVIYTNVDIALMPFFYETVSRIIKKGYESIVINRRTISNKWNKYSDINLMYADTGILHPGTDCFIIKKSIYEKFIQSDACLGALCVMKSLLYNMVAMSEKMVIIPDAHATFHIGDDRLWKNSDFDEYALHNERQAKMVALKLINISNKYKEKLKHYSLERNEIILFDLVGVSKVYKVLFIVKLRLKQYAIRLLKLFRN